MTDLVEALRSLGVSEDAIERASARGDPEGAIFESVLLAQATDRTVSPSDIERRGGPRVAELRMFVEAFGFPQPAPDEPAFTPAEADVFVALRRLQDVWPLDIALQVARVYGRLLARIAQTEVELFRIYVEPTLRAAGDGEHDGLAAVQRAFAELLPLADPLIQGVHRRWLEHELAQAAVTAVEAGSSGHLPGAVEIVVAFVDLKDFTAYAETHGDEAAVAAIDRLAATVARERGPFRFQKSLGDGVMLCYQEVRPAVTAVRRIMAALEREAPPSVHAGIHKGSAILREGDYFGSAVNVAARLLDIAQAGELRTTRPVVEACAGEPPAEAADTVHMRGLAEPLDTFRIPPLEPTES